MNRDYNRVKVTVDGDMFAIECPAHPAREDDSPTRVAPIGAAYWVALHHARGCEPLMALNRIVLHACTNCHGETTVGGAECPACFGRGVA